MLNQKKSIENTNMTYYTLSLFWFLIKPYKWYFFLSIIGMVFAVSIDIIEPYFLKLFVQMLLDKDFSSRIYLYIGLIASMQILVNAGWRIFWSSGKHWLPTSKLDAHMMATEYIQKHSMDFLINNHIGALVTKIRNLGESVNTVAIIAIADLLRPALLLVFTIIVMFFYSHKLALVLIIWSIVFLSFQYWMSKIKLRLHVPRTEAWSKFRGYIADSLMNFQTVKLFASLKNERKLILPAKAAARKASLDVWNFSEKVEWVTAFFMAIMQSAMFYIMLILYRSDVINVGDIVFIQGLIVSILYQIWGIGRAMRDIVDSFSDGKEIAEILHTPHEIVDAEKAKKLLVTKGEIEIKNLVFSYNDSEDVLNGFNLNIGSKEKVGVVGASGGGKSTLAKLLLRLVDKNSGSILIDGQEIADVQQDSLRQNISFVPQEPILFHRSIFDNIAYGKDGSTKDEVEKAAKIAHCYEFIKNLPQGFDTLVGERGVKLSGGEKQRVAIARAVLKNSPILILDEATSALDSESEMLIQDALRNLMQNKTVLVIAHRLSTIMSLDTIIVLEKGQILEKGSHEELIKQNGVYSKLWSIQTKQFID